MGLRSLWRKRNRGKSDASGKFEFPMPAQGYDVLAVAELTAAMESSEYYAERMLTARAFTNEISLLQHALTNVKINGLVLEFGVASGRTINCIAENYSGVVHGFDVFEGLPENWRTGYAKGAFAGNVPEVRKNVRLVTGLFEQTLPSFIIEDKGPVSFLHVDCDLYSSTKTIFEHLGDAIVPGTVIVFDEYFNYPGWKKHEFLAFQEFISSRKLTYTYDSFVPSHQQVCVIIQ